MNVSAFQILQYVITTIAVFILKDILINEVRVNFFTAHVLF